MTSQIMKMTPRISSEVECLTSLVIKDGFPRIVPADVFDGFLRESVQLLMVRNGMYVYPTIELVDWLREQKVDMEIGASHGCLCGALKIKGVDNFLQSKKFKVKNAAERQMWEKSMELRYASGNPPVKYGPNVIQCDAVEGVRRFKPDVVFGGSITHKWRPGDLEGNVFGVDEHKILKMVKKYIVLGNEVTFRNKPILELEHRVVKVPGMITRYINRSADCAFIWERK